MKHTNEQLAVIGSSQPSGVVMAGPGSGKTLTLAAKVTRLCTEHAAEEIVVITYTVAAANELLRRLEGLQVGFCGTLHGYCVRLLQEHGSEHHLPYQFGILDEDEAKRTLLDVAAGLRFPTSGSTAREIVANAWDKEPLSPFRSREERFVSEYRNRLAAIGMMDFDTVLHYGVRLASMLKPQDVGSILLVDEAQDMAAPDLAFCKRLPARMKWFFGDPDQAIFGFRGQACDALAVLAKELPVYVLSQNHRSDLEICEAANQLARWVSTAPAPGKKAGMFHVEHFATADQEDAALFAFLLYHATESRAVLCRTNGLAQAYATMLQEAGYVVSLSQRPVMPQDWPVALRVLGLMVYPTESGAAYLLASRGHSEAVARAMAERKSLLEMMGLVDSVNNWPDALDALVRFSASPESVHLLRQIADTLPNGASVTDLIVEAQRWARTPQGPVDESAIYCGTIHSAKGREWDAVALPSFVEGVIPHGGNPSLRDIAEEERVAYVAVTRAKHACLVTSCALHGRQSRFAVAMQDGRDK